MPYVTQNIRNELDDSIEELAEALTYEEASKKPEGSLNYAITRLICLAVNPQTYKDYNAAIGVLECVKLELYRRQVAVYEEKARSNNGDVYGRPSST